MKRSSTLILMAVCAAITLTPMDADARRGGGKGKSSGYSKANFFMIPGFNYSEKIVKVRDLPNVEALQLKDGSYVDLGYIHRFDGTGSWIGYTGSDESYVTPSRQALDTMLRLGNMRKLPPVPERPLMMDGPSVPMMIVFAVLGGGLIIKLLTILASLFQSKPSALNQLAEAAPKPVRKRARPVQRKGFGTRGVT